VKKSLKIQNQQNRSGKFKTTEEKEHEQAHQDLKNLHFSQFLGFHTFENSFTFFF
jgi:Cu/Zn superoxide dismutase